LFAWNRTATGQHMQDIKEIGNLCEPSHDLSAQVVFALSRLALYV